MINLKLKMKILEQYPHQVDFAVELGVSDDLISKVIRGRRQLTKEKKKEWAQLLQCKVSDVFIEEAETS